MELPSTSVPDLLDGNFVASKSQAQMIDDPISPAQVDTSRLEVLSEIFLHRVGEMHFRYLFRLHTTPLPAVNGEPLHWLRHGCGPSFGLTLQPKYLKSDVVLTKTWFAQAGTCPLTISLASHSLRCSSTVSSGMISTFPYPFCSKFLGACENRLEETINIFEFAPQLRWLRLTPSIGPSLPNVPWNQIKDLTMGARRIDQWYCVLRHRISRNAQYSLLTRNNIILRFNFFASIT